MTTLEKIRAEIEEDNVLYNTNITLHDNEGQYVINASEYVMQIIDKYAEREPCEDAVSRQYAIVQISWDFPNLELPRIKESMDKLPSVQPKRNE